MAMRNFFAKPDLTRIVSLSTLIGSTCISIPFSFLFAQVIEPFPAISTLVEIVDEAD
jgi:hypothetical protein